MKKLNRHIIVLFALFSYLGVFTANILHYHSYNLVVYAQNQLNTENKISSFQHSLNDCLINSTFNSLHNINSNPNKLYQNSLHSENLIIPVNSSKKQSLHFTNKKLRAPPVVHS